MASRVSAAGSLLSLISIALVLTLLFSVDSIPRVTRMVVLAAVVMLALAGLAWFLPWRRRRTEERPVEVVAAASLVDSVGPTRFPYSELARATDGFHDRLKLGQGGFGAVFHGVLRGIDVAIKRIVREGDGEKSFRAEVKTIGQLNQKNLVRLLGWCREGCGFFLVYEYMPNRSLDCFLFRPAAGSVPLPPLPWQTRYHIVQGLAAALKYLHEELRECVVHRDVKAANVMLDATFNGRLGDFGLARFVEHGNSVVTSQNAGTVEYMAPEILQRSRRPSKETDVYSFGVVALEVACGRRASSLPEQEEEKLVAWVRRCHEDGVLMRAADVGLAGRFDEGEMRRLLAVGLMCTLQDRSHRPSITQVIHHLHPEASVPDVPADTPPVPSPRLLPTMSALPPITCSVYHVGR